MSRRIPSEAFAYYASLGTDRSYEQVAAKFGVTKRAVTKYAARNGWQERLLEFEKDVSEKATARAAETIEEVRARHLKLVRVLQAKGLESLRNTSIASGAAAAKVIANAIALERTLLGEPDKGAPLSPEEMAARIRQAVAAMEASVVGPPNDSTKDPGTPGRS